MLLTPKHSVVDLGTAMSTACSIVRSQKNEDEDDLVKVSLEQRFATQIAHREVVLIKGRRGWEAVELAKLKPAKAAAVLETVVEICEASTHSPPLHHQPCRNKSQEILMHMVRQRMDAVGMSQPSVTVRFKGLTAVTEVTSRPGRTAGGMPTVASKFVEIFSDLATLTWALLSRKIKPTTNRITLLQGVSGVLVPGKITLLLGPPGSGKSTLLKALAGQVKGTSTGIRISADELTYNGVSPENFCLERTVAYIGQRDEHYAELTVQETLDFSARVQGTRRFAQLVEEVEALEKNLGKVPDPNTVAVMNAMARGGKHDLTTPLILQILGLDTCKDTIVGSAVVRGVSGGQRKRVTSGEVIMGPVRTLFCDEISTGLDSATTTDIIRSLKSYASVMGATVLVALLQPPPETYDVFDDVMILAEGHIVYHGPRTDVLPFFSSLGFECPSDVATADFLQEVVLPADQERYWRGDIGIGTGGPFRVVTPAEMAQRFVAANPAGVGALDHPFAQDATDMHVPTNILASRSYGNPKISLLKFVLSRGFTLQRRTIIISYIRLLQNSLIAFIVGTLFIQEPKSSEADGIFFLAVQFFTVIIMSMIGMSDAVVLVEMLPPFYRQRNAKFFPAWCFAVAQVTLRIPWIVADATIWSLIVYFAVGFVKDAGRFFIFWATCFMAALFGVTAFMAVAAIARKQTTSSAVQSFLLLVFVNTAGFVITPQSIPGGWIGALWANPWYFWLNGLAVNEFTSRDWSSLSSLTTPNNGTTIGESFLQSRGFVTESSIIWIGVFGWGIGSALINIAVLAAALTYLSPHHGEVVLQADADDATFSVSPLPTASTSTKTATGPLYKRDIEEGEVPTPTISKAATTAEDTGPSSNSTSPSSALPFTPLVLCFRNVKYSVPLVNHQGTAAPKPDPDPSKNDFDHGTTKCPHADQLLLLKGITGSFRPGVLTALMGASGAGKTTLLDVLAGRKTGGTITGDIFINGHPKDGATFARVAGYVEQEDIHEPLSTVREALQFSASLRLPSDVPRETTMAFVQEVETLVELSSIANSPVGLPGVSGLSVEQRKRLTLAVELVANPSIVFFDEPTSGLDSRAAGIVMRAVKNVTSTGRTVVCTIHQPSLTIFTQFQELLLLKRGGETIFFGDLGPRGSRLVEYLESLPGVPLLTDPKANPADWMLEVTSPAAEEQYCGTLSFADLYAKSELRQRAEALVEDLSTPVPGVGPLDLSSLKVVPWGRQLQELLRRDLSSYSRNLSYNITRLVISVVIGLVYGSLYQGQGTSTDTIDAVYNIAGAMFASVLFLGITDNWMVQEVSSTKRIIFYREHAAGTYSASAFSVSEALVEVPYLAAQSLLYTIIVYWMIGFAPEAGKFFWFLAIMFLTLAYFTFGGQMAVHLTPSLPLSQAVSSMIFAVLQLFCGYLKPRTMIPKGWIWVYWINPVSYTLWGLISNQLGDVEQPIETPGGGAITVAGFVEGFFGFSHSFYGWTAFILVGFCLCFRLIAFFAIRYLKFQRR